MCRKLLRLNFRLIFTSMIYALYILLALVFFLIFSTYIAWSPYIHPINFSAVVGALEYLEIGLFVMAFCHAMYWSHQPCLLEEICFIPHSSVMIYKLVASMIAAETACLIPCGFILISAVQQGTNLLFTFNTLCFTIIRWLVLLMTANTFGFVLGALVKSTYSYILVMPITVLSSYFNETIVEIFLGFHSPASRIVSQLLSVSDSYLATMEIDYSGPRVDLYFLLDALFLVFVSLLLILFLNLIVSKRLTIKKLVAVIVLTGLAGLTVLSYVELSPHEYKYKEKLYPVSYQSQPYKITDYEGIFQLSEFSDFSGSFTICPTGAQMPETLTIRLDSCFTVEELTSTGNQVTFTRDGDYIILKAPSVPTTYQIKYHGRVYYLSDIGCVNLFASWLAAALPPNFAFIPLIDGDFGTKDYDIHVASANTVISNLNVDQEDTLYRLSGKAASICIFSGFLTEYEQDGITVYRSKYNYATDYNTVLSNGLVSANYMDPYKFEIRDDGFSKPDKAFLIYDLYGVLGIPVVYEDYILLNYGFTS